MNLRRLALLSTAVLLGACASTSPPTPTVASREAAPEAWECPKDVAAGARCLKGLDSAGAHYVIVMPEKWSGVLVLHAHGGPTLGPVKFDRALEDLQRWGIWVKAGHAFAASTFRQGGVEVRAAAEDTERLRGIFLQHVAKPRRTILHGQSWGASVAAKGAEMHTAGKPYDAVLLTSGVLGGGTRSYDFRLDLRVIYQHLCNNHPRPDEPDYPLWMGLPKGSTLTQAQLRDRTKECLGLGIPAAQRSPEQARKLKTIVDVLKIPESSVQGHLNWATFHFSDIAHNRTGGRPVFGNIGAVYRGSDNDDALNAGVRRYRTDPQAVAAFAADTDPTGRIPVPVLTVHAIHDPIALVELKDQFRRTMEAGGSGDRLVKTYSDHREHSYLADPVYPTLAEALLQWVEQGRKPTPEGIAQRCIEKQATYGPGCRFVANYQPAPLDTRITPRQRP